jgi:hypothetical protein
MLTGPLFGVVSPCGNGFKGYVSKVLLFTVKEQEMKYRICQGNGRK